MQHIINSFFGFPDGSVWGNLIVDSLFSVGTTTIGYFKLKKIHNEHHDEVMRHLNPQGLNQTEENVS